uniref:Uncharacterized protein n=1 Tax=Avena sativa TaxID=4498 RepID=A0ACD5YDE5_AVESA
MRLVCLRFRHLRLATLAVVLVFLLWKWEKGSLYSPDLFRPEPLALNRNISIVEGSSTADPLGRPVAKVGNEVTAASPPLTIIRNSEDVPNSTATSPPRKKECDYRNGGWVPDDNRPLYSGLRCKRWLSESWNCRLTQRKDFAYEKFKWQPKGCDLPLFQAAQFLRRMQDKTIAYVGDSLGRQMFQSMMCMVAASGKDHSDVEDVGSDYGLALRRRAKRPDGWAYRFRSTNTTILYYWSTTLCDLEPLSPSNPGAGYAMHLDRPPSFLRKNLHRFHILVLNTGHHWNRGKLKANKWEMYASGAPNNNRKIAVIWKAKNFTIHSVMKWLDAQLPSYPHLKVFYRSLSPRHFFRLCSFCPNPDGIGTISPWVSRETKLDSEPVELIPESQRDVSLSPDLISLARFGGPAVARAEGCWRRGQEDAGDGATNLDQRASPSPLSNRRQDSQPAARVRTGDLTTVRARRRP